MTVLSLSPQVAALLARFVEEQTGLYYGDENQDLFIDKLSRRAALAGLPALAPVSIRALNSPKDMIMALLPPQSSATTTPARSARTG